MATTEKSVLEGKVAAELHQIASDLGIEGHKGLKKADLIDRILTHSNGGRGPKAASSEAPAAPPAPPAPPVTTNGETQVETPSGNGDVRTGPPEARRDERP
ncbi:MAG TPA: Rho termination factor N-terminal domain-containing protein, partial [Actinomycetota bacterium]|nr:Rho termination factor N-terminal domain-containing protein [Actinomycetota bacterium]